MLFELILFIYTIKISAISVPKKSIAKMIVATKRNFSLPRFFVRYTLPPPPKADPRPEPLDCISMEVTRSAPRII